MEWEEKHLTRLILYARSDGNTTLVYGDKKQEITMKKGERLEVAL
jgi:alpha-L-fucosidase 2